MWGVRQYVRHHSLNESKLELFGREIPPTRMTVRLATGASLTMTKRVVRIYYTLKGVKYDDESIIPDLDDKIDVIRGLLWLRRYDPQASWYRQKVDMPTACSPYGHLMNVPGIPTSMLVYYE